MFWPCCSLFSFQALLYFRHLCYFSWDHVSQGAFSLQGALFHSERFNYCVWSNNYPRSAFILLGALLFFLHSAFPFLHSAFLMLHSAFLKFSVWVSTYIFSLIVSQRAILFILVQLLFQFSSVKRLSLDCRVRFLMILCVSIVILILYKTFRFWPLV